jgi:hypothetical protein
VNVTPEVLDMMEKLHRPAPERCASFALMMGRDRPGAEPAREWRTMTMLPFRCTKKAGHAGAHSCRVPVAKATGDEHGVEFQGHVVGMVAWTDTPATIGGE